MKATKMITPQTEALEKGVGFIEGYIQIWRVVFSELAERVAGGEDVKLSDIKALKILSSEVKDQSDLKKLKEDFVKHKDLMAQVLSAKGRMSNEELKALVEEMNESH